MENEGYVVNLPPLFKGEKFDYWKYRMITFFEFRHIDICNVIKNGNYIPLDNMGEPMPRSSWFEE